MEFNDIISVTSSIGGDVTSAAPPAKVASGRPKHLPGGTIQIKRPNEESIYVHYTMWNGKVYELFVSSSDARVVHHALPLTRMTSAALRNGVPLEVVISELMACTDPDGGYFEGGGTGNRWASYYVAIGSALREFLLPDAPALPAPSKNTQECPQCRGKLRVSESCLVCDSCGYSKCG